jgi:2'-5' RNA ligase
MREPPLIVTIELDEASFAWFEDLRRRHYPEERNRVPAHLTLFHALPGEREREIAPVLEAACRGLRPIRLEVGGPWSLGRGVAYRIVSPELERLRADLAKSLEPWLAAQDRAPFRPHVTVQNKAEPESARRLLEHLLHEFEPFGALAAGLLVWRYERGLWRSLAHLPFEGE